ncbi:MAG: hypothetical protein ACJ8EL_07715, partial [Rhizomicrobium sp.]
INADGTIAGYFGDGNFVNHGFLRAADGTLTTFDVPGAVSTVANSINDNGEIAGYYNDNAGTHGFLLNAHGKYRTFDVSGSSGTFPNNVNNKGQIVGWYITGEGDYHGFVRSR